MPLYEFECQTCHHRFEKIQRVPDPDPNCTKCGGKVERLLTAAAVHFKGSGWYATDYAKSRGSSGKSESNSGEKSEAGSAVKTETKSESKTETSKSETKSEAKSDTKSSGNAKE